MDYKFYLKYYWGGGVPGDGVAGLHTLNAVASTPPPPPKKRK